ncbi:MAG: glucose 1-dehydrogenase [Acidimicrobiales bacterium]
MGRLDGKVALITGAARGQGAHEARRFVAEGAQVVVTDLLVDEGEAVAAELGDAAVFCRHDVTDEAGWVEALETAEGAFGGLDVLVNNAGVVSFGSVQDVDPAEFRRIIEINLVGCFLGIHAAAPLLGRRGGGSIVNISSVSGITATPNTAAYVASKFGLTGLTRASALDLAPLRVRVNSVHPGGVDTPMIRPVEIPAELYEPFYARLPVPRLGTVDDVANLVLFLASDESSYCTGAQFVVDGGQSCGDLGMVTPPS